MEPIKTVLLPAGTKEYANPSEIFDAAGTRFLTTWSTDNPAINVYMQEKGETIQMLKEITGSVRAMWSDMASDGSDLCVVYQEDVGGTWQVVEARFAGVFVPFSGTTPPPPPPPSGSGLVSGQTVLLEGQEVTINVANLSVKGVITSA